MPPIKSEILKGTLDCMILKTLAAQGTLHGYGIARRIEQASRNVLSLNQGTLFPALVRLEKREWIQSKWGASEKNRKAKFYSLTRAGRRQLAREMENWERSAAVVNWVLHAADVNRR
jgi:PadR family transcriptional regulator PadR